MTLDLNTFLTALYTIVDDSYKRFLAQNKPSRPGKRPELSDSEVLTLMLCAQWSGKSERRFVAYVAEHWGSYFPRMLTQSAFNRRSRDLARGCGRSVGSGGGAVGSTCRGISEHRQRSRTSDAALSRQAPSSVWR